MEFVATLVVGIKQCWRLLCGVLSSIYSAKASHAQLPDMPLRRDTQALHLIANIPLIQRGKKCHSREEKSAFTQWYSSIYARSLKDQVRKSKYPRTQILEPCTQSKLICHSSTAFIPMRSNNLIQVTSQSYRGIQVKLYRNQNEAIQLSSPSYIALPTYPYWIMLCAYHRMLPTHDLHINSLVRESLPYWRRVEAWHPL